VICFQADVDKSNSINLHELTQLLKALRMDGIMAADLSFLTDPNEGLRVILQLLCSLRLLSFSHSSLVAK